MCTQWVPMLDIILQCCIGLHDDKQCFSNSPYRLLVSWTRPSFPQHWMYFVTSTQKEGLGTLAVSPWHAGMQSHDSVMSKKSLSMHDVHMYACVVCARCMPRQGLVVCSTVVMWQLQSDWLCTHSSRCHKLMARPSFCVLVTRYMQRRRKLSLVHETNRLHAVQCL